MREVENFLYISQKPTLAQFLSLPSVGNGFASNGFANLGKSFHNPGALAYDVVVCGHTIDFFMDWRETKLTHSEYFKNVLA